MSDSRALLRGALVVAGAAALVVAAAKVRAKRNLAVTTAEDIKRQLAALDPATRAAVIARLTKDARAAFHQHSPKHGPKKKHKHG